MNKQLSPSEAADLLNRSVVPNPGIILTPGEVCYYAGNASGLKAKNQVVRTEYSSFGTSSYSSFNTGIRGYRVGMGFHNNEGVRKNVRGTVIDSYKGRLYLTNKRLVLAAYQCGFDIPLEKLTAVDSYRDGLLVTSGGKSYLVGLSHPQRLMKLVEANNALRVPEAPEPLPENAPADGRSVPAHRPMPWTGTGTYRSRGLTTALWIGFALGLLLTIFAIFKGPFQFKFFLVFGALTLGCALHLDPLNLRAKKRMLPVAATWMICIVLIILGMAIG